LINGDVAKSPLDVEEKRATEDGESWGGERHVRGRPSGQIPNINTKEEEEKKNEEIGGPGTGEELGASSTALHLWQNLIYPAAKRWRHAQYENVEKRPRNEWRGGNLKDPPME